MSTTMLPRPWGREHRGEDAPAIAVIGRGCGCNPTYGPRRSCVERGPDDAASVPQYPAEEADVGCCREGGGRRPDNRPKSVIIETSRQCLPPSEVA